MTPTHRAKEHPGELCTAWQFHPGAPIPMWVARQFHDLGGGRNRLRSRNGAELRIGDWAIAAEKMFEGEIQRLILVSPDHIFQKVFEPIP